MSWLAILDLLGLCSDLTMATMTIPDGRISGCDQLAPNYANAIHTYTYTRAQRKCNQQDFNTQKTFTGQESLQHRKTVQRQSTKECMYGRGLHIMDVLSLE